jgi:hypothetical protein
MTVEGIGDAAHVPPDAEGCRVEIDGQRIAHLGDTRAVQIETLVVRAGVLVVGADDVAPGICASMTPVGSRCPRTENAWEVQPDDRELGM